MSYVDEVLDRVIEKNPSEKEFHQAVKEVLESLRVVIEKNEEKFKKEAISEIERCAKLGFSGIGELGPGGNGYDFNDPDFIGVVECANAYHLPINIHCGEPVGHPYPGKDMTSLAPLPGLILKYPDVTFILAHIYILLHWRGCLQCSSHVCYFMCLN